MTTHEAQQVADYAKELFPITTQARIDALGVAILPYPEPMLAKRALLALSQEKEALSIPAVKARLEADARARNDQQNAKAREAMANARANAFGRMGSIEETIADISDADLLDLRDMALAANAHLDDAGRAYLRTHCPRKCGILRRFVFEFLRAGNVPAPRPAAASVPLPADLLEDVA